MDQDQPTTAQQTPKTPRGKGMGVTALIVLLLALVVGLGYFGYKNQLLEKIFPQLNPQTFQKPEFQKTPSITPPLPSPSVSAPSLPQSEAIITITSQGFIPATLSVKKNTQVTWINKDSKPHQIASDPHPAHNLYPLLNNDEEPLTTDSSLSLTFDQAGIYTYHDETNPLRLRGTIIVQ